MAAPSIDRKLPLLTSGLVVLTVIALSWPTYALIKGALLDAAGRRLTSTAMSIAELAARPTARIGDSAGGRDDETLRSYLRGDGSEREAMRVLGRVAGARDTIRAYAALLDRMGATVISFSDASTRPPRWPQAAVARGEIQGDTTSVGPFEGGNELPTVSLVRPLRERHNSGPVIGYVVESRGIASGRTAGILKRIVSPDVELIIGHPDAGVWTDFGRIAAAPRVRPVADSIVIDAEGVSVAAPVKGTNWMVWMSLPRHSVLAPLKKLAWSIAGITLIVAVAGAALMWLMTRRITHPIVELTEAAENIARDNGAPLNEPSTQIPADADEVARLRFAFERMAHRVSERQTLEMQLRHAQKMEAVGRLAGGVAHDFNNLLTAIRSYADLMLDDMPAWDPKRADALEIRNAATRAAALTAQLLAFSRKQMLQPRVLDTGSVLNEVRGMLQRLLIEDITLKIEVPDGLWRVRADRGQLEQVIVNLAVNARDAMPNGGLLHINATNEVVATAIEARNGVVPPGEYVKICVQDSGVGMDTATMVRAFEPFFTTKPTGEGTGLGLSTVDGIVAQSGGYVTIDSALQKGTTIAVFLPRVLDAVDSESKGARMPTRGSSETILLVEDELAVRALARRVLEKTGYRVLESSSPSDAIRLAGSHRNEIDLVVSDVVMPEMNGPAMVSRVLELCPTARVLFISGYADEDVIGRGLQNPGMTLLPKPFSAQELVERVRQVLDEGVAQKA
jgi:signal transduction histidine kinase/ActR/RegA family two-component response regulator